MSKNLDFFKGNSFNDVAKLFDKLAEDESSEVEKYVIPVRNGELKIIVENGIPKITYQMENGGCFVEMLAGNSLRMINV